ncbi:MAG TPA: tetratricopeptide repeat protein [Thermoanaerobaculia bacterium]|nr:tetratricopeptide repeat protein [Thermoanaerobaculia bacterium]
MRRRTFALLVCPVLSLTLATSCKSHQDLTTASSQISFGVRAAKMNLWREARFRFERAVELDPSNAMARNDLAVAYEGSGDFEKAREEYLAALQLDRSNPYIQKNYSRFMEFYTRNRRREESIVKTEASRVDAPQGEASAVTAAPPGEPPPDETDDPVSPENGDER